MPTTAEDHFTEMKREAVRNLFRGSKLEMNASRLKEFGKLACEELRGLALDAAEFARETQVSEESSGNPIDAFTGLMQETTPEIGSPRELLSWVLESNTAELIPYIGIFIEFAKGATNLKEAIRHRVQLHLADETAVAINVGDPRLAFEAMMMVVKREYQRELADGVRCLGTGVLNLGLTAGSGGVPWAGLVIGGANCVISIIEQAILRHRDEKELAAANKLLKDGEINLPKLFYGCPILGCFALATLDHSSIMTFTADEFGKDGWMEKAQKLVKEKIVPLQTEARKLVAKSRFKFTVASASAVPKSDSDESVDVIHAQNATENENYNEQRRGRANAIDYTDRAEADAIRELARRSLNAA